jgi:hypothetical protein
MTKAQAAILRRRDLPSVEELRACASHHLLYFDSTAVLVGLRAADPVAIEAGLRFLEADVRHNDSGYLKEKLWPIFRRIELSRPKRGRLEQAALGYLRRVANREFWPMCRCMARIASAGFWEKVMETARRDDAQGTRATWLLVHGANLHAGAMLRRRLSAEGHLRNYEKNMEALLRSR